MNWRVELRPEVEKDVVEAAAWYETRQPGLGAEFVEEIIRGWDKLAENPLLGCRRHPTKNVHWRYPDRFPCLRPTSRKSSPGVWEMGRKIEGYEFIPMIGHRSFPALCWLSYLKG